MRIKTETRIVRNEYNSWDVEVRAVNMDDQTDTTKWFLTGSCGCKQTAKEIAYWAREHMTWSESDPNDEVDIVL